jgi:hypothetical protein
MPYPMNGGKEGFKWEFGQGMEAKRLINKGVDKPNGGGSHGTASPHVPP